jgi:hypothetical protein
MMKKQPCSEINAFKNSDPVKEKGGKPDRKPYPLAYVVRNP